MGHFYYPPPPHPMYKKKVIHATNNFAQVDECCLHAIRRVFCIYKDHLHTRKMTYTFKQINVCLSGQVNLWNYFAHRILISIFFLKKINIVYINVMLRLAKSYLNLLYYNIINSWTPFPVLKYKLQRIGFCIWILWTLFMNITRKRRALVLFLNHFFLKFTSMCLLKIIIDKYWKLWVKPYKTGFKKYVTRIYKM